MLDEYRLDGHIPVRCDREESIEEHRRRRLGIDTGSDPWRVARTEVGTMYVSTVFLGIDHRFSEDDPPELFETMIFGLPDGEELQWHCSTWDQAVVQHDDAARAIDRGRNN